MLTLEWYAYKAPSVWNCPLYQNNPAYFDEGIRYFMYLLCQNIAHKYFSIKDLVYIPFLSLCTKIQLLLVCLYH